MLPTFPPLKSCNEDKLTLSPVLLELWFNNFEMNCSQWGVRWVWHGPECWSGVVVVVLVVLNTSGGPRSRSTDEFRLVAPTAQTPADRRVEWLSWKGRGAPHSSRHKQFVSILYIVLWTLHITAPPLIIILVNSTYWRKKKIYKICFQTGGQPNPGLHRQSPKGNRLVAEALENTRLHPRSHEYREDKRNKAQDSPERGCTAQPPEASPPQADHSRTSGAPAPEVGGSRRDQESRWFSTPFISTCPSSEERRPFSEANCGF